MQRSILALVSPFALAGALACTKPPAAPVTTTTPCPAPAGAAATAAGTTQAPAPTSADATAFVTKVNEDLKRLGTLAQTGDWIKNTYITDDTERTAAALNEQYLGYLGEAVKKAASFGKLELTPDTSRMLLLLRVANAVVAPSDDAKRLELTTLAAKMEGMYGKAKACGAEGNGKCQDIEALTSLMAKSRSYQELLDGWVGWHRAARDMKALYGRYVELVNEGAREVGFADAGEMWRSAYDMPPDQFRTESARIWGQVEPFYKELHCYVRGRLASTYGKDKVPPTGPIPAHLLGNMWAQEWGNIYPLVEPYKGQAALDVSKEIERQKIDAVKMAKIGEAFFTSIGLDPLPKTFWERSMFVKPADREVMCHASAWDVNFGDDLRIKMCIKPTEEDLRTIHHELGHNYYFHYYYKLPFLYQNSANDGFHEAIGDAIALSITPGYWKQIGLLKSVSTDRKALINVQMKQALDKVAFLPFGKLIDEWRWDVFSGKTTPDQYNQAWWALRLKYQGVTPPVARTEADFDPGAKYHIPANVPYTRYFLARILMFQFHRAMCRAAGFTGPLHECSVYGNKAAGAKLRALLELGASKPWPVALETMTGEKDLDASAMLEYFAPLREWLAEQNKGQQCGW